MKQKTVELITVSFLALGKVLEIFGAWIQSKGQR